MKTAVVSVVSVAAVLAVAATLVVAAARRETIVLLPDPRGPLAATQFERDLSHSFVEDAQGRLGESGVSWGWRNCVLATHVRSLPLPDGPVSRIKEREAALMTFYVPGYSVHPAKGYFEIVLSATNDVAFRVMPLVEDVEKSDVAPFEADLIRANPNKLLVVAVQENCPDPDPWWKDRARALVNLIR